MHAYKSKNESVQPYMHTLTHTDVFKLDLFLPTFFPRPVCRMSAQMAYAQAGIPDFSMAEADSKERRFEAKHWAVIRPMGWVLQEELLELLQEGQAAATLRCFDIWNSCFFHAATCWILGRWVCRNMNLPGISAAEGPPHNWFALSRRTADEISAKCTDTLKKNNNQRNTQ